MATPLGLRYSPSVANKNAFDLVTLKQISPAGPSQRCHLAGDDTYGGGEAQWNTVDRPRRRSIPEWVGTDLHTLALPLMLDGFGTGTGAANVNIEAVCQLLESWREPVDSLGRPPAITVDGPIRQPAYKPWWVVTGIEWGAQFRGSDGGRIQQQVTLTLLEYLAGSVLIGPAAAARAAAGLT